MGRMECPDGSDEYNCTNKCTGFLCHDGECIGNVSLCDQIQDCSDGSDEKNCKHECPEYTCPNSSHCISWGDLCDGLPDCLFGEDELNCTICPTNMTHCNQTYCKPKETFCDGHDDCGDGSDEVGCSTPPTTPPPKKCVHTLMKIRTQIDDVSLAGNPTGLTSQVFTSQGWPAKLNGKKNTLAIGLDSDVTPEINEIYFKVTGVQSGDVSISIETTNGTQSVEEVKKITKDPTKVYAFLHAKFQAIYIETTGTVSDLIMEVCYKPPKPTTTPTTPTTTTTPTTYTTKTTPTTYTTKTTPTTYTT